MCMYLHIVAYSPDGSPLRRLECTKCGVGFHPSTSQRRCVPCHPSFASGENENGTCRCSEVSHSEFGGVCFTQQELDDPLFDAKSAYKIEYDGFKVESLLFRENLAKAFYLCKARRSTTLRIKLLSFSISIASHLIRYWELHKCACPSIKLCVNICKL